MKIGNVEVGSLILAPMAGVTDVGFRKVARENGADFSFTEMINANGLCYNPEKTKNLLHTENVESPVGVQLFGHNEEYISKAITSPLLEKFDIIDINMGCPAPKIVNNGEGVALMNDLPLASKIISSAIKNTNKPVTVKFRKGFKDNGSQCFELLKICEDNGVSAVTIHGRTHYDGYSGMVDYDTIAKLKAVSKIPVIGNGDVTNLVSYKKMLETGVDAVMIGRGALGQPWIFNAIKGEVHVDKYCLIKQHIDTLRKYYDEDYLCSYIRKHLLWYVRDIENTAEYRLNLATCQNLDNALVIIKKIFNS